MIDWWVYPAVLGGLAVLGWIVNLLVRRVAPDGSIGRRHGLATVVLGDDGRTSTSKLQAALWTLAILWAVVSLLAGAGVEAFGKALGGENLREEYLLLLGGPFAAAIAAKGITMKNTLDRPEAKPPKGDDEPGGIGARVAEVFTNDAGGVDLGDFQYAAFTLVTLAYFAWAFIETPTQGLPPIPGTLLVLVGVSQATYVGKKGLLQPKGDMSPADPKPAGDTPAKAAPPAKPAATRDDA
jgi:hypothetical protein